jgi:DNA-binding MarR family transcriptional regulator
LRQIGVGIAATCAGFNLRRASRAVTQHFDHALAPVGLRTTQFTLLAALALAGPVSTNELAVGLVVDRTTLTRNLRLLREAGLVERQRSATGREIRFVLSEAGREALARAVPVWQAAQHGIEEAFGAARWPRMVAELDRLVHGTLVLDPNGQPAVPHPGIQPAIQQAIPAVAAVLRNGAVPEPGGCSHDRPAPVIGS